MTPCSLAERYPSGTEVKANLASEALKVEYNGSGFERGCKSTSMAGRSETEGGESSPVEIALSSFTLGGCECTVTVLKPGRLIAQSVEGLMSGPVRWTGFEIKENCSFFGECVWGGKASKGIFLKGGAEAVLRFEEAVLPRKSGESSACLFGAKWTGEYKISTPKPLYVSGKSSESLTGEGTLCRETTAPCGTGTYGSGTSIKASLEKGTTSLIDAGFPSFKCEASTIEGEVLGPGGTGEPVVGTVSSLSFGSCNCKATVLKPGRFTVNWTEGTNGKLTLLGYEIALDCGGKECTFAGNTTEKATLEGGEPASIKLQEAPVPKKTGVAECNSTAKWTAEYEVSVPNPFEAEPEPTPLYVVKN